jgi:amino acid permease
MEDVPEIKAIARSRANTPLLGGDWDEVEGLQAGGRDGGIRSSIYTLVSTMMGGGILSLPYAIQSAGLVLGPCLLVAVGVASRLSLWLTLTSGASLRASSYEAMVAATLGPRAAVLVTVALALLLWFVIVAYSILLGDLLTPVLAALTGGSIGGISAPRGLLSARSATMLAGHLAVLPATTRPSIGEMNGASALSLGTTTALALLISARSVIAIVARGSLLSPLAAGASGLMLPRGGARGVLNATSIIAVSFLCHFNLLPVSDELAR